jgi:hypothetical protein
MIETFLAGRVSGAGTYEAAVRSRSGSYRALSGPLEHRHLEVFQPVVDLGGITTPLPVQFLHDLDASSPRRLGGRAARGAGLPSRP